MKKSIKYFIIGIVVLLVLGGIWFLFNNGRKEVNKDVGPQKISGISMVIKDGTLTKISATVVITDVIKGEDHAYGSSFRIEKKENDKWVKLDTIIDDYGFTAMAYYVDENNKLEMNVKWDWLYGELQKGEYRLIKIVILSYKSQLGKSLN